MITSQEKELLGRVASDAGWSLVDTFARTRREQPDEFNRGSAHLIARLQELGLSVRAETARIYQGVPRGAQLHCEGQSFGCKAAAISPCQDASDYGSIRGMAEAQPLVAGAVEDLFGQACRLERPGRAGDYSFNNLGITGAMLTSAMVPPEERKRRGWYSVGGAGRSQPSCLYQPAARCQPIARRTRERPGGAPSLNRRMQCARLTGR